MEIRMDVGDRDRKKWRSRVQGIRVDTRVTKRKCLSQSLSWCSQCHSCKCKVWKWINSAERVVSCKLQGCKGHRIRKLEKETVTTAQHDTTMHRELHLQ